jgi:ubiquitin carboxyl-terminal hydrolase 14
MIILLWQEEVAKIADPSGLVNLGNTCYLNSVVQCLRQVPSLRQSLMAYPGNRAPRVGAGGQPVNSSANPLLTTMKDLYYSMDRSTNPLPPSQFVMATKMAFPQFAQTGPQGQPMQQDAEEFYSQLLNVLSEELQGKPAIDSAFGGKPVGEDQLMGARNAVDAMFGIKLEETLTCDEITPVTGGDTAMEEDDNTTAAAATATKRYDLQRKLVCNIQGGAGQTTNASAPPVDINHIGEGIHLALAGKIEKHSDVLGRNAMWTKTQRIARLPPLLTVQFGRFYWKLTPDSADHTGVKCKIMKPVTFQSTLDLYEFCSKDVQKVLKVHRDRAAAAEEERLNAKATAAQEELKKSGTETAGDEKKKEDGDAAAMDTTTTATAAADTETDAAMEGVDDEEAEALKAALAMSMQEDAPPQPPVGPGLPDNFQGIYELFAVVTHKGRDADGGHYMGWVKAEGQGDDDWYVFDDDEVSPCKTEDVLKLKGGGDWHMSYLNFYRAKNPSKED